MPYNKRSIENTTPTQNFNQTTQTQANWNNAIMQNNPTQFTPQQQTRQPGLEYTGVFTGAEMKGQGTIPSGKRQGQPWTLLRLNFVTGTPENQRNTHFSAFTPLTQKNGKGLQPHQLEFGKEYKVLYNEKPYTNEYGPQIGKTAFMILEPTLNQQRQAFQPQIQQQPLPTPFQQSMVKTPANALPVNYNVAGLNVLPEFQQLWNNSTFNTFDEWMQIAEQSGLFDSPEEAKQVHDILSQQ